MVELLLAAPGIEVFNKDMEGKSALDVASNPAVASLLEEVVDVKHTYSALLIALMHHGVSRADASDVAMHYLPTEHAKAMASRMRDTWPADPSPPSADLAGGEPTRASFARKNTPSISKNHVADHARPLTLLLPLLQLLLLLQVLRPCAHLLRRPLAVQAGEEREAGA